MVEVWEFIDQHDSLFVIEQNRDAQMKTLILAEAKVNHKKLISVLCFDGAPITAAFISKTIMKYLSKDTLAKTVEEIL